MRLAVFVSQREVELQYNDELLAKESADRRVRVCLDHLIDLAANLNLISLGVLGPRRRHAIELIFHVIERDGGIQVGRLGLGCTQRVRMRCKQPADR